VSQPCTVLIAAPDLLPTLKARTATGDGELLAFTDAEALKALEVITKRRPAVVALERLFAATPRGAALINRIKADPSLSGSEIRVISHDTEYTRVSARRPDQGPAGAGAAVAVTAASPAPPLDQRGTRRAVRHKVAGQVEVLVDGNPATLVDVSTVGAQVVTAVVLKPNQRIRLALPEGTGAIRFNASVAWAKFEIGKAGPRYRAGVAFVNADPAAVDAYCARHKA
jgi:hypothetical protein